MKIVLQTIALSVVSTLVNCTNIHEDLNDKNIEKIKIGMTAQQVRKIMGSPDRIEHLSSTQDEIDFQFNSPFAYSDDFHIFISTRDSLVVRISDKG